MNPNETPLGTEEPTTTAEAQDVGEVLDAMLEDDKTADQARQTQDSLLTLYKHHPECILDYMETVASKLPIRVAPISEGAPVDPNHTTQPFLTHFEKTKILGFRTNQLAQGARPYVEVPAYITKTLEIAKMELEQRRLPFILKRPLPDGTFEYWRLSDLTVF